MQGEREGWDKIHTGKEGRLERTSDSGYVMTLTDYQHYVN